MGEALIIWGGAIALYIVGVVAVIACAISRNSDDD